MFRSVGETMSCHCLVESLEGRCMLSGTPPAGPTALKVAQSSATALTLRWKDNANNESGFKILRSIDGTLFRQINAIAANLTSYVNGKLKTGTHYWYRVIAFNAAG